VKSDLGARDARRAAVDNAEYKVLSAECGINNGGFYLLSATPPPYPLGCQRKRQQQFHRHAQIKFAGEVLILAYLYQFCFDGSSRHAMSNARGVVPNVLSSSKIPPGRSVMEFTSGRMVNRTRKPYSDSSCCMAFRFRVRRTASFEQAERDD